MKINMSKLRRVDFTSECKQCPFCKDLGMLEYCCSFVVDIIREQRLADIKSKVYDYIDFNEDLSILDSSNLLFSKDDEFKVTVTFQTNLKEDKMLILSKIRESLIESRYFAHVDFERNSLIKNESNNDSIILQSKIDEFIDHQVNAK